MKPPTSLGKLLGNTLFASSLGIPHCFESTSVFFWDFGQLYKEIKRWIWPTDPAHLSPSGINKSKNKSWLHVMYLCQPQIYMKTILLFSWSRYTWKQLCCSAGEYTIPPSFSENYHVFHIQKLVNHWVLPKICILRNSRFGIWMKVVRRWDWVKPKQIYWWHNIWWWKM